MCGNYCELWYLHIQLALNGNVHLTQKSHSQSRTTITNYLVLTLEMLLPSYHNNLDGD